MVFACLGNTNENSTMKRTCRFLDPPPHSTSSNVLCVVSQQPLFVSAVCTTSDYGRKCPTWCIIVWCDTGPRGVSRVLTSISLRCAISCRALIQPSSILFTFSLPPSILFKILQIATLIFGRHIGLCNSIH